MTAFHARCDNYYIDRGDGHRFEKLLLDVVSLDEIGNLWSLLWKAIVYPMMNLLLLFCHMCMISMGMRL
ncbi:hypothetical protein [Candidatus Erwinia haradaeae]|uniref:hypothetical protein n=1 Tax=Candidatus Erwinia haradaeae TaxID=1922217 RepID=UPI0013001A21|nr:hypothetical protein [Candidatus Erwinia haradaeae]